MSFILLIEGGTSSGKSTLADFLSISSFQKQATVSLIKQDNYYKDLSHLTEKQIDSYNFDSPDAINIQQFSHDMKKLAKGKRIKKRHYDFKEHRNYTTNEWINPAEIIIGEGLFVFNAEIDNAIRIFIDMDDDIRLIRRLQRDKRERGISTQKTIEHYLDTVKPMHEKYIRPAKKQADIILSKLNGKNVKEIATILIEQLKGNIL